MIHMDADCGTEDSLLEQNNISSYILVNFLVSYLLLITGSIKEMMKWIQDKYHILLSVYCYYNYKVDTIHDSCTFKGFQNDVNM